jgi:dihydroorotate dehydrogenase (NAD+) catalytic subunit
MNIISTQVIVMLPRLRPGTVSVGGVRLGNHLLLAAGILGTTGSSLMRILEQGAGGVVTKSIGPIACDGHPGPCVAIVDCGVINAMGLPNPSHDFVEELTPLSGQPVIASIFGANPREFREVAGWFYEHVAAYELNLSCPHAAGYGAALGSDPSMVEECTRAVADLGLPTWVKLTPNVTDITACGRAAERGGASAVVAINTVKAMRVSPELRRPVLGYGFGGLSGKAIFPIAVRCVYELFEACSIPVIGCGGISTGRDVIEMMMAGASAVQIGTAVMDDPAVFRTISSSLYEEGGKDPESIVGCAHG